MSFLQRILNSISTTGLVVGLAMFCASLSPSLLPREHIVQGILSGVVFAIGYLIGHAGYGLYRFMELKDMADHVARITKWILLAVLGLTSLFTLNRMTVWQNSIRVRMEMIPIDGAIADFTLPKSI